MLRAGLWLAAARRENRNFLALLCAIVFFKSAIADLSSISGASMLPTLIDGDKVWVNKLAYDVEGAVYRRFARQGVRSGPGRHRHYR